MPDDNTITNTTTTNTLRDSVTDGALKDYANPKAALTIGASSAMVIAFTSTLCSSFPLPSALTALLISVIFGSIMVYYLNEKALLKIFYGFVVTMLIFHTARGGNETLGEATGGHKNIPSAEIIIPKVSDNYSFSIIPSAYAADSVSTNVNVADKFYFAYMGKDGYPVYTNRAGVIYVDTNYKPNVFKRWKF